MLNLCSDGHDEICYEGRDCPLCIAVSDIESLKKELEEALKRESED